MAILQIIGALCFLAIFGFSVAAVLFDPFEGFNDPY
jgi:hypothetical protein